MLANRFDAGKRKDSFVFFVCFAGSKTAKSVGPIFPNFVIDKRKEIL